MDAGAIAKVFISYSRKDSEFISRISTALAARSIDVLIDQHDIAPGEPWRERISKLLKSADSVVVVISPDSVRSLACQSEIDEADRLGKKLLPVLCRPTPDNDIPGRILRLNFIKFLLLDQFDEALNNLVTALSVDLVWIRQYTRFGELSSEWEAAGRSKFYLLRGEHLKTAELWISSRPSNAPEVIQSIRDLVLESRRDEQSRELAEREQLALVRREQEARARFQRRSAYALYIVAILLAAGSIGSILFARDTLRREARVFSSLAATAASKGRYDQAMRFAMAALPSRHVRWLTGWPIAAEAQLAGAAMMTRLEHILRQERGEVRTGAFSPDGRTAIIGTWSGAALLWSLDSRNSPIDLTPAHRGPILSTAFDSSGRYVATTSEDKSAQLWDAVTGRPKGARLVHAQKVWHLAFNKSGSLLATASEDETAAIWDVLTGKQLVRLKHSSSVNSVSFSPEGTKLLTSSNDGIARVWSVDDGIQLVEVRHKQPISSDAGQLKTARFNANGDRILAVTRKGQVFLWTFPGGVELPLACGPHSSSARVRDSQFSTDGGLIAVAMSDGIAAVCESETGKEFATFGGQEGDLTQIRFSHDDGMLVASGWDGTVRLWDLRKKIQKAEFKGHEAGINFVDFSFDNARLLSGSEDGSARVWRTDSDVGRLIVPEENVEAKSLAVSQKGTHFLVGTDKGALRIYDTNGSLLMEDLAYSSKVSQAVFSYDESRIAAAYIDGTVRVVRVDLTQSKPLSLEICRFPTVGDGARSVAFGSTGRYLVTGHTDGKARIWDPVECKELLTLEGGHKEAITATEFDKSEKYVLTASWDKQALLWNWRDRTVDRRFKDVHKGQLRGAQISPTGSILVTTSVDSTAVVWSFQDAKPLRVLRSKQALRSAAFSEDGGRLVTTGLDGDVTIWDVNSGERVVSLPSQHGEALSAKFADGGRSLLVTYHDGAVFRWMTLWAVGLQDEALVRKVCGGRLPPGAATFSRAELADPIFADRSQESPCEHLLTMY